jgi:transcription elongation factor Elf1
MNLSLCPYCNLPGLVTTVKVHGSGMEVTGKCTTCGYSYDSEYAPAEANDDLPGDFTRPLDTTAVD